LELPFDKKWNDKYLDILDKIINYYNVIPIIAHIERYKSLNIKVTKKLSDLGCIIQMNTSSILDKKNNTRCVHLLKSGLIDVLGSDCHNMKNRMPIFMEALSFIAENFGENTCYMLDYNSECIINNIEIKKKVNYIIGK
jgi:protein-tyrosine phosphatase